MIDLLIAFVLGSLIVPIVASRLGRQVFFVAACFPFVALIYTLAQAPAVLGGEVITERAMWVAGLHLEFSFRLDPLAWLMALLVSLVGTLVLIYSARYFSRTATSIGRFAAVFLAFAGSMFGLVTSDNTLIMYVMWELTTVFSFLLIGHYQARRASRRAAMEAIIVTTLGGLAMLAGIITLGEAEGGSYSFHKLLKAATAGELAGNIVPWAIGLILAGAITKSAIFPFHFWLPAAMAAPTPVSAYLHAAAMVKAGVYLVARLAPGFADLGVWRWLVVPLGLYTMLLGGYRSLRQYDTKLVLAYGTVSQLGFLMVLVGHGSAEVALAGLALLLAHALFKACLFLCVGIVDWATGTRDLRELSGMGRRHPVLAACAGIAVASMAGIPPFAGYVGKEAALHGLMDTTSDRIIAWILVVGSALTLAYGLRFWWGCFSSKAGVEPTPIKQRSRIIMIAPALLAVASLALGLTPGIFEDLVSGHAATYPGPAGHLTLWGGFGLPVIQTLLVIAIGLALFWARRPVEAVQGRLEFPLSAESAYRHTILGLEKVAGEITSRTQSGSQPLYLALTLLVTCLGGFAALYWGGTEVEVRWKLWDVWGQLPVAIVAAAAAILAARARRRLKAVLLLGVSGYGVALMYELHGAPDLALTQMLVETITLVVFVLVLRRLPAYFSNRPLATSAWVRAGLGIMSGLAVAVFIVLSASSRTLAPVSSSFADEAFQYGYGRNVVNVTLVDIRAWDTMGEISVVVVCAVGVASLLFIRDKAGRIDSLRNLPSEDKRGIVWRNPQGADRRREILAQRGAVPVEDHQVRVPGRNIRWLPGSRTLAPERRSVIFEVATRIIYHTMLIGSLFFLFSGHNQPGGGFAGGLLAGIALTVRYLAGGRYELGAALPVHPGYVMGAGLFIATTAALVPVAVGGTTLQTALLDFELPGFGPVHFATALIFDIGVYLVVIGLSLDILRSLGAEIDRHGQLEGMDSLGEREPTPHADRRGQDAARLEAKEGMT